MNDAKIVVLEERVSGMSATVGRVEDKIDKLGDTLAGIVRIEERQMTNSLQIAEARADISAQSVRLEKIEIQMPGLAEKARWVVGALLGVCAAVGTAVLAMVIKAT